MKTFSVTIEYRSGAVKVEVKASNGYTAIKAAKAELKVREVAISSYATIAKIPLEVPLAA